MEGERPPVRLGDVVIHFSQEEWGSLQDWQKKLYLDVTRDHYEMFHSLAEDYASMKLEPLAGLVKRRDLASRRRAVHSMKMGPSSGCSLPKKALWWTKANGGRQWDLAALQRQIGVLQRSSVEAQIERRLIIKRLQGVKQEQQILRTYMEQSRLDILRKLEEINQDLFSYKAPMDYGVAIPPDYIMDVSPSQEEQRTCSYSFPSYDPPSLLAETPVTGMRPCSSPVSAHSMKDSAQDIFEVTTINLYTSQSSPVQTTTLVSPDIPIMVSTLELPTRPVSPDLQARTSTLESTTGPVSPDLQARMSILKTTTRPLSPDPEARMSTLKTTTRPVSPDLQARICNLKTTTKPVSPDLQARIYNLKTTTRPVSPDLQARIYNLKTTTRPVSPDLQARVYNLKTTTRPVSPDLQARMPTLQIASTSNQIMPTVKTETSTSPNIQPSIPEFSSAFHLGNQTLSDLLMDDRNSISDNAQSVQLKSESTSTQSDDKNSLLVSPNKWTACSEDSCDSFFEVSKPMKWKKEKGPFKGTKISILSATNSTLSKFHESSTLRKDTSHKSSVETTPKQMVKKIIDPPWTWRPNKDRCPIVTNGRVAKSKAPSSPPIAQHHSVPATATNHCPPLKKPRLDASHESKMDGPCLPDVEMCLLSHERIEKLYGASQGSLLRFAGLVFRSLVPLPTYLQWCHMANYNGTHQKKAIPQNVKNKLLSHMGQYFYILGPAEKQQIRDGVNNQLRNPRKTSFHPGVF